MEAQEYILQEDSTNKQQQNDEPMMNQDIFDILTHQNSNKNQIDDNQNQDLQELQEYNDEIDEKRISSEMLRQSWGTTNQNVNDDQLEK